MLSSRVRWERARVAHGEPYETQPLSPPPAPDPGVSGSGGAPPGCEFGCFDQNGTYYTPNGAGIYGGSDSVYAGDAWDDPAGYTPTENGRGGWYIFGPVNTTPVNPVVSAYTPSGSSGPTPWYKNSCITGALASNALSVGLDALGLIPEAGGVARFIGNQAGYRGVVADQLGAKIINAFGKSTSTVTGLVGLTDTSALGLASTALTIVGFIPLAGSVPSAISLGVDLFKTYQAVSACHG